MGGKGLKVHIFESPRKCETCVADHAEAGRAAVAAAKVHNLGGGLIHGIFVSVSTCNEEAVCGYLMAVNGDVLVGEDRRKAGPALLGVVVDGLGDLGDEAEEGRRVVGGSR